jgi:tRNA (adenine22-N1)-methyltransferase
MTLKISDRLQRIANEVPLGCTLADIGSDHALLPVFLVKQGKINRAVASEINEGPFLRAQQQVKLSNLEPFVEVRLGDGLDVLRQNEVQVIVIAGMGGSLMTSILTQGLDKLKQVQKLILQPNLSENVLRKWLVQHNWLLTKEIIFEEDKHIYEILVAEAHDEAVQKNQDLYQSRTYFEGCMVSTEMLYQMGPYLMEQASETWIHKWQLELVKWQRISEQILQAQTHQHPSKLKKIAQHISEIKEVLQCTQKGKPLSNGWNN